MAQPMTMAVRSSSSAGDAECLAIRARAWVITAIVAVTPCQMVKTRCTLPLMNKIAIAGSVLLAASASSLLGQTSADIAAGRAQPSPLAPGEIVARAPGRDWTAIPASDLLVMDLAADAQGRPRRVVIQLMPPPFSPGWIGNIRKLAAAHWWDGTAINRVQDNYVVQWGDPDADDKAKAKALPAGLATVPESAYVTPYQRGMFASYGGSAGFGSVGNQTDLAAPPDWPPTSFSDPYSPDVAFAGGFPVAMNWSVTRNGDDAARSAPSAVWPVHCYGMVGVGRDLSPDTGSGAELYTVIGHAPRHLDRNIALVGRVIEGMEHLSSMPRGHGALGFYDLAQGDERVPILSMRIGTKVPGLPAYEYLNTESDSFAHYADARANRRDAFFIRPAGGADICNVPVPVRRTAR